MKERKKERKKEINLIGNSFDNLIKGTLYNRAPAGKTELLKQ